MSWLERGSGGTAVACLASYATAYMHEIHDEIVTAFEEMNVKNETTKNSQVYIAIRHYLRLLSESKLEEYYACREIVALETEFHPEIRLFNRPDCDEHFAEQAKKFKFAGKQFAGQFFGIEKLYGLNYRKDDYEIWTDKLDEETRKAITDEATRLLTTFFSNETYAVIVK